MSCAAEVAPTYGAAMRAYQHRRSGDVERLREVDRAGPGVRGGAGDGGAVGGVHGGAVRRPGRGRGRRAGPGRRTSGSGRSWPRSRETVERGHVGREAAVAGPPRRAPRRPDGPDGRGVPAACMGTDPERRRPRPSGGLARSHGRRRRGRRCCSGSSGWPRRTGATSTGRTGSRPAASSSTRAAFAGGHPMAHVYFETGDHVERPGLARRLARRAPTRRRCSGATWSGTRALHHLALGDGEGALARYPLLRRLGRRRPAHRRTVAAVALPAARPLAARHRPRGAARERPWPRRT